MGIGGGGVREVKPRDRLNSFFLGGYRFSKSPKSMGKSNSFFISPVLFNQGHRMTVSS